MKEKPFWKTTPLAEMSDEQWESLCDGCGKCCLHKLQDEDTEEVYFTRVACQLLDLNTGRCSDYPNRFRRVDDCVNLRTLEDDQFAWLPATCAYRLVHEGRNLPPWHHLRSGHSDMVHQAINTVIGRAVPESEVDMEEIEHEIVYWVDE